MTKELGKGTGLGLSMAYGIVKQSGGYIDVEGEPGQGTGLKIFLPRVAAEEPSSAPPSVTSDPRGSETVLLVEDKDTVRGLTRIALEQYGYTVLGST